MAERDEAGVACQQVEAHRQQAVDENAQAERDVETGTELGYRRRQQDDRDEDACPGPPGVSGKCPDQRAHQSAVLPNRPCGRQSRISTIGAKSEK